MQSLKHETYFLVDTGDPGITPILGIEKKIMFYLYTLDSGINVAPEMNVRLLKFSHYNLLFWGAVC